MFGTLLDWLIAALPWQAQLALALLLIALIVALVFLL